MDLTTCQAAMTAAVLLFGSFFCLAFAAAATVSLAAMAVDATTAAATTVVSGSSYCSSSAVAMASALAAMAVDAATIVDAPHHGITAVEILAETTVAANLFENGLGGIFGCPS